MKFVKKLFIFIICLLIATTCLFCGCTSNNPDVSEPPTTPPTEPPAEEKVVVSTIVNEYFGNRNFENEFNNSLITIASKKVEKENIKSVELVSFEKGQSGSFVLNVKYKDELALEDDELTYNGDTREFSTFYYLSTNKDAVVNAILTENNVTLTSEVVKDSTEHTSLKTDCAEEIADYDTEKALFEGILANDITIKEDPAPVVEYVTIQSLVDKVFAGIDFEANLKESATAIVKTKAPINNVNKIYAVDFELAEDGTVKIIAETQPTTSQQNLITSWTANIDTTQIANYLTLSKDFKGMITKMLADESVTLETNVDKNSQQKAEILEALNNLKQKYLSEKDFFNSTAKSDIQTLVLLTPAQFDSAKMTELGITSMNDFAEALLTNQNGQDFDLVTGWTTDDVVVTYVSEFSGEGIDYSSGVEILIISKEKTYNYLVWTQRSYGDTTDRYSMILNDNPNVGIKSVTPVAEYSENAILFDANGNKIHESTAEPQQYSVMLDDKIIGVYDLTKEDKFRLF